MALEFCAVEGCGEYPAWERLTMTFREPDGTEMRVELPLCAEHNRRLEAWKAKVLPSKAEAED